VSGSPCLTFVLPSARPFRRCSDGLQVAIIFEWRHRSCQGGIALSGKAAGELWVKEETDKSLISKPLSNPGNENQA
jgi:hypothetical protein